MLSTLFRWGINYFAMFCLLMLSIVFIDDRMFRDTFFDFSSLQPFKTIFISIILEAIPFVLLGVFLSSLLQIFVSEKTIRRWIPTNPILGVLFACLLGLVFPVCECGLIPIVRRMIQKGMPVYVGVTFILSGPIINPVVYAATYMAFRTQHEMAYSRMILAFIVACAVGLATHLVIKNNPLRTSASSLPHHDHVHEYGHHEHEHEHTHEPIRQNKLSALLTHAADEFFEMGKFLMFGAVLTALIQTLVARESLNAIGQMPVASHLFMMGYAYVLSLCSTSDAFVASSFLSTFSKGSLLTFLVLGPMLDLKGTMMLFHVFKPRFVLFISLLVAIFVLSGSMLIERLYF